MSVARRITCFTSVLFIINSISSIPVPNKENPTEKLSDEKSVETDPGTVSPKELENLKDDILEFEKENDEKFGLNLTSKPKEVKTYLKNEEQKYGKKLPETVEESLTEGDDDLTNLAHFLALFHEIKAKNGGVDVLEKDSAEIKELGKIEEESAEMKEMREEMFRLSNALNKQKGLPEASQEEFNVVWNIQKKDYGKEFPEVMKKLIVVMRKTVEENESTTEKTTTLEASEAATVSSTESSDVDVIKEESPKGAFILKNAKGKVCILAKFQSSIVITYPGKSSEQKVEVTIPHNSNTKGKCRGPNGSALLQITWGKFIFSLTFNKTTNETWGVTLVELVYDTSEPLFDGTLERTKITAKNKKASLFETPFGKSYVCAAQEVILLYKEDKHVATVRLNEIHLQPYDVEDGKFSEGHHCNKVVLGDPDEEPFVQDETVPLAVGCTLALITLLILVAFSVHRAYNAAKVDYNTVE